MLFAYFQIVSRYTVTVSREFAEEERERDEPDRLSDGTTLDFATSEVSGAENSKVAVAIDSNIASTELELRETVVDGRRTVDGALGDALPDMAEVRIIEVEEVSVVGETVSEGAGHLEEGNGQDDLEYEPIDDELPEDVDPEGESEDMLRLGAELDTMR